MEESQPYKLDWSCVSCGGEGIVELEEGLEEAVYIICDNCSYPNAQVFCKKCQAGGRFTKTDFTKKPLTWVCRECGSEYPLPPDFYQKPHHLHPKSYSDRNIEIAKDYSYISVPWLKMVVIFKEKFVKSKIFTLGIPAGFAAVFLFGIADTKLPNDLLKKVIINMLVGIMIFTAVLIAFYVILAVVSWTISQVFLQIYKFRKKWE